MQSQSSKESIILFKSIKTVKDYQFHSIIPTNYCIIPLACRNEKVYIWISKEAINNSFKYANASQIKYRLLKSGDEIVLEIEDNGIGFINLNQRGNGLQNMKKRAYDIGALFELKTSQKGTLIRVVLNHHNWWANFLALL